MNNLIVNPAKIALVAISRDEARLWLNGIGPEDMPLYVKPPLEVDHRHRRTGQFHHGHDTEHRLPEYFESIAERIRSHDGILLMGHGEGKAAYNSLLQEYLAKKHPDIATRILDSLSINLNALSEHEVTMEARHWFEKNLQKLATWHGRIPPKWFA